jgi:glyoxylase-like metal-dependent hydrolase (beta-lactamase superfamily II)
VLYHVVNAHTDGDTFVWLPRSNILHTGDILERSSSPFIDFWTGGSLAGMVAGIDRAIAIGNDSTAFVPGHGAVSSREDLKRYRAMLLDLQQTVRAEMARGLSVDAVIAAKPAAKYLEPLGGERRAAYFIRQIYYGERFAKARTPAR